MIGNAKQFNSNKTMSFKVNDKEQFKKYIEIQGENQQFNE